MRVALVTYGLHVGGMESFLLMLAEELRAKGMQVSFVITEKIGAWHRLAVEKGFKAIVVRPSPWRTRRWHALQVAAELQEFDAVLLNHSAAAQPVLGELPANCLIMALLHNDQESIYRVGLSNLGNLDYLVCVGSKILSEAKRLGAAPSQAVHIPYGVNVSTTWPKEHVSTQTGRPLKVIFVGRVDHEQKGVLDLPLILAEARRLGVKTTFEVVGDGEPDLTTLRNKFAAILPDLQVVYHGKKDNMDALQLLGQADILLMPSRFEGLPVTLLEAIARGVVPVASFLPGITDDAVTNGVNGLLPTVGDISGFARAIARLQDDNLRLQMSRAAWQEARDKFNKELMVDRYLRLLHSPCTKKVRSCREVDSIGRVLFGLGWSVPVGLTKTASAIRKRRFLVVIQRLMRRYAH